MREGHNFRCGFFSFLLLVLDPKVVELFQCVQLKGFSDEFLGLGDATPCPLPSLTQLSVFMLQSLHSFVIHLFIVRATLTLNSQCLILCSASSRRSEGMLWGSRLEYTHSHTQLRGCASSRLPFQARDLKRRYGSMSSLAGAFRASGLIRRLM